MYILLHQLLQTI